MSWEEDYLMRRVGELTAVLKELDMLEECASCTTLFAADLDECPNCGHPKGEPKSPAMTGDRPTPLGGVESTAGANALPPQTVHGGADPNAVREAAERREQERSDGDDGGEKTDGVPDSRPATADAAGAPEETIDSEPKRYEEANVETLRAEVKRRRDNDNRLILVSSSAKKPELIDALRKDDRARAEETTRSA